MADTITNMKVRFSADTKQFKKGMDEGQQAMQQFKSDAGNAIDQFAAAFGVNMNEIRGGVASMKASLMGISTGFKAAATGSGFLTKAMQVLKVALISTGIGALVVALGSLVAYFTKTERGAEKLQQIMAGFKAVFNVLIDRLALFGEGVWKIFTGDFKGAWESLKNSVKGVGAEIFNEAKAATILERRLQELEDREISLIEVQSEREKLIAEAREKSIDATISAQERLKALRQASELENKTLQENLSMQRERVSIMQEQFNMGSKTDDQLRSLNEEKAKLNQLETESSRHQKTLQKDINRVTSEIAAETKAIREQQIALREKQNEELEGFKPLKSITLDTGLKLDFKGLELDKLAATIKTGLEPAKDLIMDFAETFNSAFEDIATGFGENIGEMLAGTSGFKDLGGMLLGTLGDLAIKVGKMAVATGIAISGIKKALVSLNPAVAIAGGIALIAIGSLIKSSLAGAASGGGGGGTFSGNTGEGGGYSYDTRAIAGKVAGTTEPIKVQVSGTFRQRGTDLVAVVNETQTRQPYKR